MHKKNLVGAAFVLAGLGLLALVLAPFFVSEGMAILLLKVVALVFGGIIGALIFWIGVQLILAPPPKPLEEIERELEEEVEKIKEEVRGMLSDRTEG